MEDYEQYQTFLNRKMSPFWKGTCLFVVTFLLAYPILQLETPSLRTEIYAINLYTVLALSMAYWLLIIGIWMICLSTLVSVTKSKKLHYLPAMILSMITILVAFFN